MAAEVINVMLPPGRMVQGDLYNPRTKDDKGQPLLIKYGPNAGQPRADYFIAIAIPKTPGVTHWAYETHPNPKIGAWGAAIYQHALKAWPQGQPTRGDFAWKIEDGDSTIPNKVGRINANTEGMRGCWIVKLGGSYAPRICNADGSQTIDAVGAVKRGYYVQCYISVKSNESQQTAGMYLNHVAVAMTAYGEEITSGPDISQVGFGGVALPPGASATPLGAMTPPGQMPGQMPQPGALPGLPPQQQMPGAMPGAMPQPGMMPQPGALPGLPPQQQMPAAMPQQQMPAAMPGMPQPMQPGMPLPAPNMGFVQGPQAAPPPPQRQLVPGPQAGGITIDAYRAAGWSDDQMISTGKAQWSA